MFDAETGQRGYLLTGDEAYLGPYHQATATIDAAFERLSKSAAGSADQIRALNTLRRIAGDKLAGT